MVQPIEDRSEIERLKLQQRRKFGECLNKYRREAKLSQQRLADRAGVSRPYVSGMGLGLLGPPSKDVIRRLAKSLAEEHDESYEHIGDRLYLSAGMLPPDLAELLDKDPERIAVVRTTVRGEST